MRLTLMLLFVAVSGLCLADTQPSPQTPAKATPQAVPGPPAQPQPPPPPAPLAPRPERDEPRPPVETPAPAPAPSIPPAPIGGTAKRTSTTTTTETTTEQGGVIIYNNAANSYNAVGNSGWSQTTHPGVIPASYQRRADFATPPTDGAMVQVQTVGQDRTVPITQASRIELAQPGLFRRQMYAWFPGHRHLATPRAVVATTITIPIQPVAPPSAPAPAPSLQALPVPTHGGKSCFGFSR